MAINNKPASVYAQPHTMSGKKVGNELPAESTQDGSSYMNEMKISNGNVTKGPSAGVKTDGIKQRGSGAATKGFTSRGPMA